MDYIPQDALVLKVQNLPQIHLDRSLVLDLYIQEHGKILSFNDLIKVSPQNEGKDIKFETLDNISIVISVNESRGGFNKIE